MYHIFGQNWKVLYIYIYLNNQFYDPSISVSLSINPDFPLKSQVGFNLLNPDLLASTFSEFFVVAVVCEIFSFQDWFWFLTSTLLAHGKHMWEDRGSLLFPSSLYLVVLVSFRILCYSSILLLLLRSSCYFVVVIFLSI